MDTVQLTTMWEQALKKMEGEVIKPLFNTWLKDTIALSLNGKTLEIGAPKQITKEWLESKYVPLILDAVHYVTNQNYELKFTNLNLTADESPDENSANLDEPAEKTIPESPELHADAETLQDIPENNKKNQNTVNIIPNNYRTYAENSKQFIHLSSTEKINEQMAASPKTTLSAQQISADESPILNPKYIFETFVIGNSNRFAHAASLAVAESPAEVYNPFFIYGGVGLGKTHLMHAIGHRIIKNHPQMRVMYISSEKFTNDLINSIRDNKPESFRQKYRNIDVLLVDDIQFLTKKERTQEEFFHTFNTLHEANKQIIISSDRPPREIQTLEDRLRSRFEWGLITDIQPPDLETRIAILRKKAMIENLNIPNDVMVYIASRIDNNIRELEGALIRIMAYASLNNQNITMDLATEALKDIFPNGRPKQITMELIQEIVSSYFKIKVDDLIAKKRTRNVTYPRQIAMYLCRELTDTSLPRIGEVFGGRDHTTVIHAHDKITRERNEDDKLSNTIKELIKKIESI